MRKRRPMWILAADALLLLLAMYQIVRIFWETPQTVRLQPSVYGGFQEVQPQEDANLLRPWNLYITLGGGDGSYSRLTQRDEEMETVFEPAYLFLCRVLQEAKLLPVEEGQLPRQQEACILAYEFALDSALLEAQMELSLQTEEAQETEWSQIWLVPAQTRSEEAQVYLVNPQTGQHLRASGNGWAWEENQELLSCLLEQGIRLEKSYIDSAAAWPQWDIVSAFMPEQMKREKAVRVKVRSAFMTADTIDEMKMREYGLSFFSYPETVTIKQQGNTMLFSDEKQTVKLDARGRVQYVETLTDEEKEPTSMRQAYQLAVGFLEQDLSREGASCLNVVLTGYEQRDNQYLFQFDYRIDGIRFHMEESRRSEWRMEYPVQITVEGTQIRRYERYALHFSVEENSEYTLQSTWVDALDVMTGRKYLLSALPQPGYYRSGDQLSLMWTAPAGEEEARVPAR